MGSSWCGSKLPPKCQGWGVRLDYSFCLSEPTGFNNEPYVCKPGSTPRLFSCLATSVAPLPRPTTMGASNEVEARGWPKPRTSSSTRKVITTSSSHTSALATPSASGNPSFYVPLEREECDDVAQTCFHRCLPRYGGDGALRCPGECVGSS